MSAMDPSRKMVGKRRKSSPTNQSGVNTNFNSGTKSKKSANHHERIPRIDTPLNAKKTEKTIQELIDGFDRTHTRVNNSKLPRAVHKPSALATMERRHSGHSYTWGESSRSSPRSEPALEFTGHDVERLVKNEINNMQEKINSLKESLFKCSHGIELIQREQSDIFQRYEAFIGHCTSDMKEKKQNSLHKEGFTLPPINQWTTLTHGGGNGGHDDTDKSTMISNIKKIARKRSNELALRETDHDATRACDTNIAKQTTSNEELRRHEEIRKGARIVKAKEAVRRAAAQHIRKREMSATQPRESKEVIKSETGYKIDPKIVKVLREHDEKVKSSKNSKKE